MNYTKEDKGFTLIELIVVIAIIAVLAAIVAPNAFKAIEKAKITEAIGDFKAYKTAVYALYTDTGHWVTDVNRYFRISGNNNDLIVNLNNWAGWDGPYLEKIKSRHPWKGSYYLAGAAAHHSFYGRATHLVLEFEDYCFPSGPNGGCPIPANSGQRIDLTIDDGNLRTGDFIGGGDYHWILVKDAY